MAIGRGDEYRLSTKDINVNPLPEATRRSTWWFRRWIVTAPSLDGLADFEMPPPQCEFMVSASVLFSNLGYVTVDVGEPFGEISEEALTYAAILVSELRCCLGEGTAVDGDAKHTLFLLVKWDCDRLRRDNPVNRDVD